MSFDDVNARLLREVTENRLAAAVEARGQVAPARARQVARLLRDDFSLEHGASNDWELRHKSGRPTDDVLKDELSKPDYDHFKDEATPARDPGHVAKAVSDAPPSNLADDLARRVKQQMAEIPGYIPARGLRRIT